MTHSTGKVFKLTAAGSIRKALGDVVEAKRNITISALFHGLISSNVLRYGAAHSAAYQVQQRVR